MSPAKASGSAPGRLDFMGGVADYSGSLVLQYPIAARTTVEIADVRSDSIRLSAESEDPAEMPLRELADALADGGSPEAFGRHLRGLGLPAWSRYPLGCLFVFCHAKGWLPERGLTFAVRSQVPRSMGVSSSAALEIATLRALEDFSGIACEGLEIAHLGQAAENRVVGAPCGLMDQLASAFAPAGKLLPILCRPDQIREPLFLPPGTLVVGWPSGVRHAVSDSPYGTARTAAFMGKRILEEGVGRPWTFAAEIPPDLLRRQAPECLPESMHGKEYQARFDGVDDPLSTVEADRTYPVRAAVSFAVEENARCEEAARLLADGADPRATPRRIGELLYASHEGYRAMDLSCPEVDAMVSAIRKCGEIDGFFGARVSGGGSGGTVVVLLEEEALPRLEALAHDLVPAPDRPQALVR